MGGKEFYQLTCTWPNSFLAHSLAINPLNKTAKFLHNDQLYACYNSWKIMKYWSVFLGILSPLMHFLSAEHTTSLLYHYQDIKMIYKYVYIYEEHWKTVSDWERVKLKCRNLRMSVTQPNVWTLAIIGVYGNTTNTTILRVGDWKFTKSYSWIFSEYRIFVFTLICPA